MSDDNNQPPIEGEQGEEEQNNPQINPQQQGNVDTNQGQVATGAIPRVPQQNVDSESVPYAPPPTGPVHQLSASERNLRDQLQRFNRDDSALNEEEKDFLAQALNKLGNNQGFESITEALEVSDKLFRHLMQVQQTTTAQAMHDNRNLNRSLRDIDQHRIEVSERLKDKEREALMLSHERYRLREELRKKDEERTRYIEALQRRGEDTTQYNPQQENFDQNDYFLNEVIPPAIPPMEPNRRDRVRFRNPIDDSNEDPSTDTINRGNASNQRHTQNEDGTDTIQGSNAPNRRHNQNDDGMSTLSEHQEADILRLIRIEQEQFVKRVQNRRVVGFIPMPNSHMSELEKLHKLTDDISEKCRKRFREDLRDKYCGDKSHPKTNTPISVLCHKVKEIAEEYKLSDKAALRLVQDKLIGPIAEEVYERMKNDNTPESIWTMVQSTLRTVAAPSQAKDKLQKLRDDPNGKTILQLINEIYNNVCWANDEEEPSREKNIHMANQARGYLEDLIFKHCSPFIYKEVEKQEKYLREIYSRDVTRLRDPRAYEIYSEAVRQTVPNHTKLETWKSYNKDQINVQVNRHVTKAEAQRHKNNFKKKMNNSSIQGGNSQKQSNSGRPNNGGNNNHQKWNSNNNNYHKQNDKQNGNKGNSNPNYQNNRNGNKNNNANASKGKPQTSAINQGQSSKKNGNGNNGKQSKFGRPSNNMCWACGCTNVNDHLDYRQCQIYPNLKIDWSKEPCRTCSGRHNPQPCKSPHKKQ